MASVDCINDGVSIVIHGMNQSYATNNGIAQAGAVAYAENVRYSYLANKDNISFAQGTGQRLVTESGSGRTRAETNAPTSTSAGGTTP